MSTCHRIHLLGAALAAFWAPGCGDDDAAGADAAGIDADTGTDAAPVDSSVPDAFDPCPGILTYEANAIEFTAGSNLFEVGVLEVANPSNTASSAPNGRLQLCLDPPADFDLRFNKTSYVDRLETIDLAVAQTLEALAADAFPVAMITTTDADALLKSVTLARAPADALVFVEVRTYPGGMPTTGATVSIGASNDGNFVRMGGSGTFSSGNTIDLDALVFFANADPTGGTTSLAITPASGFTCTGPATISLEAGTVSAVLVSCTAQ